MPLSTKTILWFCETREFSKEQQKLLDSLPSKKFRELNLRWPREETASEWCNSSLQWDYQKDGSRFSMVVHGTGCHTDKLHKLKKKIIWLYIEESFFTIKIFRYWNRLPGDAVQSPFSGIFWTWLNKTLSSLVWPHSLPWCEETGLETVWASLWSELSHDLKVGCVEPVLLQALSEEKWEPLKGYSSDLT